jgi:hypothetical protein
MEGFSRTVITVPDFDSGRYEDCDFLMSKGAALLTIYVTDMPPFKIQFSRVRWHEFTALYNCSAEQVKSAYFALVEIVESPSLTAYIANDKAVIKAYRELHHYRIFLDETGCHELFAQSCSAF